MDSLKEDQGYYASPRHREVLRALLAHPDPDLIPEVRMEFDRKAFFDYFVGIAEWLYRKYHP